MSKPTRQAKSALTPIRCLAAALTVASLTSSCSFVGASTAEDTLVFGGFGGDMETAMVKRVIPAFEKKYDVEVTYVEGTSDELLAKARNEASGLDVIWTNDSTHFDGKEAGLYAQLDPNRVQNLKGVYAFARDPADIGVVTGIQALGLTYNTQVFKEHGWAPPNSWRDLWDARFKGHILGYNIPIGYTNLLLVRAAELNGGSPSNLEPGWNAMERLIPRAAAWVDPPEQFEALLSDGTGWLGFNGSARAYAAMAAGEPVGFVDPEEGSIAYPQYFDVLKSAPHQELAQEFVDFALRPDSQKAMAEVAMLGPVNKSVRLPEHVAKTVVYGQQEVENLGFVDSQYVNEDLTAVTNRWTRLVGSS